MAQGPKTSQEGLLLLGGFQESTGKNLKDDKKGLEKTRISADNKTTIHGTDNQTSESDYDYEDSDSESDSDSDYEESDYEDSDYEQTSELLDGEREHVLTGVHYTECALCETPFIEYGDIYCKDGCPKEALERLDDNLQPVKANNDEKITTEIINANFASEIETAVGTRSRNVRNVTLDIEKTDTAETATGNTNKNGSYSNVGEDGNVESTNRTANGETSATISTNIDDGNTIKAHYLNKRH